MDMSLNVLLCLAAPLLVMFFIVSERSVRRVLVFLILGMLACFAAGYVNSFIGQLTHLSLVESALFIAPIAEECLKAIPIVIFFLLIKPDFKTLLPVAISVGVGFATLESVMYLIMGVSDPVNVLLRGFSTGVMHAMTVSLFAVLLWYVTQKGLTPSWFITVMCGFGILAGGITLHGCYNLMINTQGVVQSVGYAIPIAVAAVYAVSLFIWDRRVKRMRGDGGTGP